MLTGGLPARGKQVPEFCGQGLLSRIFSIDLALFESADWHGKYSYVWTKQIGDAPDLSHVNVSRYQQLQTCLGEVA